MMIRQDFEARETLPPKMFLMQILDKLPKTYCFLWEKKDDLNRVIITWKDLTKYYNKNAFRTALRKLCNEGLLNYSENDEQVIIDMTGWDDIAE